jgi:hypothetical protein
LDAVLGEEDVGAVVEVYFMVFAMAEEGGDEVEDELGAVEGEQDGGHAVDGAVLDELDA